MQEKRTIARPFNAVSSEISLKYKRIFSFLLKCSILREPLTATKFCFSAKRQKFRANAKFSLKILTFLKIAGFLFHKYFRELWTCVFMKMRITKVFVSIPLITATSRRSLFVIVTVCESQLPIPTVFLIYYTTLLLKWILFFLMGRSCQIDGLRAENWFLELSRNQVWIHRLNMELDLQSLFGLLCAAVLIGWDPATPPPRICIWAQIRGRYWSAKIDDISL